MPGPQGEEADKQEDLPGNGFDPDQGSSRLQFLECRECHEQRRGDKIDFQQAVTFQQPFFHRDVRSQQKITKQDPPRDPCLTRRNSILSLPVTHPLL